MKKIFLFVFLVPFLFSCNWEIPKSLSVKTKADYNFSFGKLDKDLSEHISVETLKQNAGTSAKNATIEFYDYNPEEKAKKQMYLLDCSMVKIPIDFGSYLNDLDFSKDFQDKFTFEKQIDIPSVSSDNLSSPLDVAALTDNLNEKITSDFVLSGLGSLPFIGGIAIDTPVSFDDINITITAPEMSTATFSSGKFQISFATTDDKSKLNTNMTMSVCDESGSVIAFAENINLHDVSTVEIPLAGKTLTKGLKLKFSGTASNTGSLVTFNMSASLSSDTKLSKVTGITLDDPITVPITGQNVTVSFDESLVECIVGVGKLSIKAKLPSGWTGVTATPSVDLTGSLAVTSSAFVDKTKAGDLFCLEADLAGGSFSSGELQIDGSVDVVLSNATIILEGGVCPEINMNVGCDVQKLTSVTVDLSKGESGIAAENLVYNYNQSLPADAVKAVTAIVLDKPTFNIEYINTLPVGNNITLQVDSTFFGITGGSSSLTSVKNVYTAADPIVGAADNSVSTSLPVDVAAKIVLPGATVSHPTYLTLSDIQIGQSYKIGIQIKPDFDWKSITIDPTKLTTSELSGTVDTAFKLKEIFKTYATDLGDDFINKIQFDDIKVSSYFVVPDLTGLSSFGFTGDIKAYTATDKSDSVSLRGSEPSSDPISTVVKIPELVKDKDNVVISKVRKEDASYYDADKIKGLLNNGGDNSVKVDYNISLAGSQVTINKSDLDSLSDIAISVAMRVELALSCEITDDIDVDITKMASISTGDIFSRSEATDVSDAQKYLDAIRETVVVYDTDNRVAVYQPDVSGKIPAPKLVVSFNDDVASGSPASKVNGGNPFEMVFGKGKFVVTGHEFVDLLGCYPVQLNLHAILPKGSMYMPRDMGVGLDIIMRVSTDGTINVFGGE